MSAADDAAWINAEDEWRLAFDPIFGIFGASKRDLKPLARMLRSETPIPPGVRDTLAELLDPGTPAIYDLKFQIVETSPGAFKPGGGALGKWLPVARDYAKDRADGMLFKDAIREVGQKHNVDERHVSRLVEAWEALEARLHAKDIAR